MLRNPRRLLTPVIVAAAALTATAVAAPPAYAECRAERVYTVVKGGYWDSYEALFVPPTRGPVTQTITNTRTRSTATEVSAELGISVNTFITELNASVGASYQETATVEEGRSTTVTAPRSRANQEIRFGTFKQKIRVDLRYYGCPFADTPDKTTFEYAAKESAGVVKV